MDNGKVTSRQVVCIMSLFIIGSTTILGSGLQAKQDAGVAILLAMIFAIPLYLIYSRIMSRFPDKDFFEILDVVYGKIIGGFFTAIYTWYFFHLGSLVLRNFSEFIKAVTIPQTPHYTILIVMGLLVAWTLKEGLEVLGRLAVIALPLNILQNIILIILSIPLFDIDLVRPLFYNGFKPILNGAFAVFVFPFGQMVVFLFFLNKVINKNSSNKKLFLLSLLLGGTSIFLVTVRSILILGIEVLTKLYYPSYASVRLINIGNFLQRIEVLVSVAFLFAGLIKTGLCIYVSSKGVSKLFKIKDYKVVVAPITLLMMHLACIVYKSTIEMFAWTREVGPYYEFPFQVILPVLTLLIAKIRFRQRKTKNS